MSATSSAVSIAPMVIPACRTLDGYRASSRPRGNPNAGRALDMLPRPPGMIDLLHPPRVGMRGGSEKDAGGATRVVPMAASHLAQSFRAALGHPKAIERTGTGGTPVPHPPHE
jgi:hypothetical protein